MMEFENRKLCIEHINEQLKDGYIDLGAHDQDEIEILKEAMYWLANADLKMYGFDKYLGSLDKIKLIKVSSKCMKYLDSQPSSFVDVPSELSDGVIGRWDSCLIEVDDTIDGYYKVVWKDNEMV